ncbi:MAG: DUF1284 domain-containing protein [Lachnospiraceae bacterium]|nr:DUF1284 domain-containing protein [Lachnospiraceae bacterium]
MIRLRPHHGMCLYFFQGKGYSSAFVENMAHYRQLLLREDPMIRLTLGTDDLCAKCPHNQNGVCDSADKVKDYDAKVLEYCGLQAGAEMHYSTFSRLVECKILKTGKRTEICGRCQWDPLCAIRHISYNLRLI